MERCSASLILREMQIKITLRYHLTPARMAIIKKSTNKKRWRDGNKAPGRLGSVPTLCWHSSLLRAPPRQGLGVAKPGYCVPVGRQKRQASGAPWLARQMGSGGRLPPPPGIRRPRCCIHHSCNAAQESSLLEA